VGIFANSIKSLLMALQFFFIFIFIFSYKNRGYFENFDTHPFGFNGKSKQRREIENNWKIDTLNWEFFKSLGR
jgi:hypothetical protein